MKKLLLLAILCCFTAFAQQGPAYSGDYVNYTFTGKQEKVKLSLPKGAKATSDSTFVINGKTYRIRETSIDKYLPKPAKADTLAPRAGMDATVHTQLWLKKGIQRPADGYDFHNVETKIGMSPDNEAISTFYGYDANDSTKKMTDRLQGAKIVGDSVITITLDEDMVPLSDEIEQEKKKIFDMLDSAAPTTPAKNSTPL